MSTRSRIRGQIPDGGWYVSMAAVSLIVGLAGGLGVSDLFPDGSSGPLLIGTVVATSLFTVLAGIGAIGGRILVAFTELAPEKTSAAGPGSRD